MSHTQDILNNTLTQFGDAVTQGQTSFGMDEITVHRDALIDVVNYLYSQGFTFLIDLTGVHYPDRQGEELAMVCHVQDMKNRARIRIKAYTSAENPHIDSLTPIFSAANWMERETYDFYGILFDGHPNLIRILNVDEMDYFPMRKEYPLEDQTREDKDDEMFGRNSLKKY